MFVFSARRWLKLSFRLSFSHDGRADGDRLQMTFGVVDNHLDYKGKPCRNVSHPGEAGAKSDFPAHYAKCEPPTIPVNTSLS